MQIVGYQVEIEAAFELANRPLEDARLNGISVQRDQDHQHETSDRNGRDGQHAHYAATHFVILVGGTANRDRGSGRVKRGCLEGHPRRERTYPIWIGVQA